MALGVVVLAVAGFAAWYVFSDNAPAKPKLPEVQTSATSTARSSVDGKWTVATGSGVYVGYRVQEQFGGETVKKDAVGRTPKVSGSMTIADDTVTAATVTADLQALDSGRAARDRYLHTSSLETDKIPTTTFTLTQPVELGDVAPGKDQKFVIGGNLNLHGVTRPVQLTVDARWTGDRIDVVGTAPIKFSDYEIAQPQTPIVKTADNGSLELSLVFHPAT
jgi:polyisoprenoid-binding protein YceI